MPIQKDNFFSLSKSERRATLLLLILVLLLVGARGVQHYLYSQKQGHPTEQFEMFQSTLIEFNNSLQEEKNPHPEEGSAKTDKAKKKIPPKSLNRVPREE